MIRLFLTFTFINVSLSFSLSQEIESFPDSMYHHHNWKTFVKLKALQDTLDFRQIDYQLLNAAVFYLTNKKRINHGRIPLSFSPKLRDMARFHSSQMAKFDFVDHVNTRNPRFSTVKKTE